MKVSRVARRSQGIGHVSGDGIDGMGSHGLAIIPHHLLPLNANGKRTKGEDQVKYKENRERIQE